MGLYYRRDVMIPSHRSWRRLFDGGCTSWWWLFFKFYSRTGLEENRIQTMHIQSSGSQTSRNVSANEYKKCKFYLQTIHSEHKWVIFKSFACNVCHQLRILAFPLLSERFWRHGRSEGYGRRQELLCFGRAHSSADYKTNTNVQEALRGYKLIKKMR